MVQTSNGASEMRRPGWWSGRSAGQKWVIGIGGAIAALAILVSFFRTGDDEEIIPFSQVIESARNGDVERIDVRDDRLRVYLRGARAPVQSRIESDLELTRELRDEDISIGGTSGVELRFREPSAAGNWLGLILNFAPLVIFYPLTYFLVRNAVREGIRQGRRDS